jgi:hypothetical protein
MDAFYKMHVNGSLWTGCSIRPLSQDLMEKGMQALKMHGEKTWPSLHLRSLEGECAQRFDEKTFLCTKRVSKVETVDNPCNINMRSLAYRYPAKNFLVFSDGQDKYLEDQFSAVDHHDFFTQYAMMVQTPRHIGNVLSTVDLLVSQWREQVHGPGTTYPGGCYE